MSHTAELRVHRFHGTTREDRVDHVALEEPLEIRVAFERRGRRTTRAISVTMRTPGHDLELAAGYLWSEGILTDPAQIADLRWCGPEGAAPTHTVKLTLAPGVEVDLARLARHTTTTSSCGLCGKTSLEAVATRGAPRLGDGPRVRAAVLHALPRRLREAQPAFARTGGLHATGLFTADGALRTAREDVGRHNAFDKVVGHHVLAGEPHLRDHVVVVSGRASFELVQKAIMAAVPVLVAVGAPSSLAVELAAAHGLTLVGFTRDDRFNVYTGVHRLDGPP